MKLGTGVILTEAEFESWLEGLLSLYPQVNTVALVGSRALGCPKPDSDWDVVLCLDDDCYQDGCQVDGIEQRIAFDPDLHTAAIDLFFLRPSSGGLGRWEFGPDEPCPPADTGDAYADEYIRSCYLAGTPLGDFTRLYRSLERAKILYQRDQAT